MNDFFAYMVVGLGLAVAASYAYVKYLEFSGADFDHKIEMISELVMAAEQRLGGEPGVERFNWVIARVQRWFPDADTDELEALIEAAVYRLHRAQAQPGVDAQGDAFWFGNHEVS